MTENEIWESTVRLLDDIPKPREGKGSNPAMAYCREIRKAFEITRSMQASKSMRELRAYYKKLAEYTLSLR